VGGKGKELHSQGGPGYLGGGERGAMVAEGRMTSKRALILQGWGREDQLKEKTKTRD